MANWAVPDVFALKLLSKLITRAANRSIVRARRRDLFAGGMVQHPGQRPKFIFPVIYVTAGCPRGPAGPEFQIYGDQEIIGITGKPFSVLMSWTANVS